MTFRYFPDTDMLYIELISGVSTESEEVAPGIVLDFDDKEPCDRHRDRGCQ
ncbi:MAG TPA: DUF2283 domain-containing protein [Candidatus Binatia bacterium]|nr:DUF2283 domain-containing protein [Candidatus Binatia bacterium]